MSEKEPLTGQENLSRLTCLTTEPHHIPSPKGTKGEMVFGGFYCFTSDNLTETLRNLTTISIFWEWGATDPVAEFVSSIPPNIIPTVSPSPHRMYMETGVPNNARKSF